MRQLSAVSLMVFSLLAARPAPAEPLTGQAAPAFSLPGSDGKTYRLSDYKGRFIVLEWMNHGCPFIKKHYSTGNMQRLQDKYTAKGVVWFSILSSAPGKQGYATAAQANKDRDASRAHPTAVLLDPSGTVGRLYGAKTTPTMFVIAPTGKVVYHGAIDNRPTTDPEDVKGASNFVASALDQAMQGQPVMVPSVPSYGCSVKYE